MGIRVARLIQVRRVRRNVPLAIETRRYAAAFMRWSIIMFALVHCIMMIIDHVQLSFHVIIIMAFSEKNRRISGENDV